MIRLGLRARLLGAVLLVLAGLLATTATVAVVRTGRALHEAHKARALAATEQLAKNIRYGVLARSEALIAPAVDALAETPDFLSVEVLDDRGARIIRRGAHAAGAIRIERPVFSGGVLAGPNDGELEMFGVGDTEPTQIGRIVALFSVDSTMAIEARLRRDLLIVFLGVGLLGLLLVGALASSVVGRIRRLASAARSVADGQLEVRLADSGADEIAQLTRAFNRMTASLMTQRADLDQAADQLAERESLAAIGRATAVIAHELRNPLGIVLGAAAVVQQKGRPVEQQRQAARIIGEEVERLNRTLEQLLGYARPQPPQRCAFDALAVCRSTAERVVLPGGPAVGVLVEVTGRSLPVRADEQQIAQVLLNLLTNAAQAGAKHIGLHCTVEAGRAKIDVEDDGPGIDAAVSAKLFRPFVTTKQRGAGLGLAASRRMARDNSGELDLVECALGAHFRLDLELAEEANP